MTDLNGIGHNGGAGALTYPVKQQLANFCPVNNNTLNSNSDVVFIFGDNNDIFCWTVAVATLSSGVTPAIATAQVQQAATDLVGYAKDMTSKNATQFYVSNLPNSSLTSQDVAGGAAGQALLYTLVDAFNTALQAGPAGTDAHMIDFDSQLTAVIQSGATFGFNDASVPAYDATKINTFTPGAGGNSLLCPASTSMTASADTSYLFTDEVHPTTDGHRLIFSDVP